MWLSTPLPAAVGPHLPWGVESRKLGHAQGPLTRTRKQSKGATLGGNREATPAQGQPSAGCVGSLALGVTVAQALCAGPSRDQVTTFPTVLNKQHLELPLFYPKLPPLSPSCVRNYAPLFPDLCTLGTLRPPTVMGGRPARAEAVSPPSGHLGCPAKSDCLFPVS